MALNWDVSQVKDRDDLWTPDPEKPDHFKLKSVPETLIWYCLALEMNGITEKNKREFFFRMTFHDRINGPFLHSKDDKSLIGYPEIERHIGLKTNVRELTRNQFLKKMGEIHWRRMVEKFIKDEQKLKLGEPVEAFK